MSRIRSRPTRFATRIVLGTIVLLLGGGCKREALERPAAKDGGAGLNPAQAALALAQVGDETITLGQFAATLERMDQFDRMRYNTPDRRRELLEEMIVVELLAREAQRRGLENDPEVQQGLRQVLRDALLAEARKSVRAPMDISEEEVRAYYEAHREEYSDPERRRVATIVLADREAAMRVLEKAKGATTAQWAQLVREHTPPASKAQAPKETPPESAGDLGMVGPPGNVRSANPRVADVVRAAVFEIGEVNSVLDHPVQDDQGKWHIVRLTGKAEPHTRSFGEAEKQVRVAMVQQQIEQQEKLLEAELRQKYAVVVDEKALEDVKLPPGFEPGKGTKGARNDEHANP